jgi:hypothetical protein
MKKFAIASIVLLLAGMGLALRQAGSCALGAEGASSCASQLPPILLRYSLLRSGFMPHQHCTLLRQIDASSMAESSAMKIFSTIF